ncbi:MAG: hypothetical protein ACRENP_11945 [Longimicrobiales bacterium]
MKAINITIGLLLSAVVCNNAAAQWNVARYDAGQNRVFTTIGLDPALVTSVGYARVLPVLGHNFQLAADAGVVAAGVDTRDFRTRVDLQSSILQWRSLRLVGSATFITRGTENSIYRGLNFGADFTGIAGVYRSRWFAAGQFGKDKAIITHIKHTDWYRNNYYPDAKDGWYLDAGGTFHYGLVSGFSIGKAELVGRAGFLRTEDFHNLTPPMYASLGLGFSF